MTIYAGLDVSDKQTHVYMVDAEGKVVRRDCVASDPEALANTRAVLVGRKLLQGKLLDVELSIRGILL